jgi:hypothetical protein
MIMTKVNPERNGAKNTTKNAAILGIFGIDVMIDTVSNA